MRQTFAFLIALTLLPLFAYPFGKGTLGVSGSALYSNCFDISNRPNPAKHGIGSYLYVDYQVLDWMSLGVGGGKSVYYKDDRKRKLESVDAMGRLILPKTLGKLSPYLIGGFGYRPIMKGKRDYWQGHYHGMMGAGTRIDFTGQNPGSGLDISLVLNGYSPKKTPLKTFDFRVGYSVAFGGKTGPAKPQAAPISSSEAAPWWGEPFYAPVAFAKLRYQLIPERVRTGDLALLNTEAVAFLNKVDHKNLVGTSYAQYGSAYFTALAQELDRVGDRAKAWLYLDKAIQFLPTNQEALNLQAQWARQEGASVVPTPRATLLAPRVWWKTPFDPVDAFETLKTKIVPQRVQQRQMTPLNTEAAQYFNQLKARKVDLAVYNGYLADYYTTVAQEVYKLGYQAQAQAWLEKALQAVPDYPAAKTLKAQWGFLPAR